MGRPMNNHTMWLSVILHGLLQAIKGTGTVGKSSEWDHCGTTLWNVGWLILVI